MTGWNIDLIKRSDLEKQLMAETFGVDRDEKEEEVSDLGGVPVDDLVGLSPKWLEKLKEAGYTTIESLEGVTREQLMEIPGVGAATADKMLTAVRAAQ